MIAFRCPQCKHAYEVPDDYGGGSATCKHCATRIGIPQPRNSETKDVGWMEDLAQREVHSCMMICTGCKNDIEVSVEHVGQIVVCTLCGKSFRATHEHSKEYHRKLLPNVNRSQELKHRPHGRIGQAGARLAGGKWPRTVTVLLVFFAITVVSIKIARDVIEQGRTTLRIEARIEAAQAQQRRHSLQEAARQERITRKEEARQEEITARRQEETRRQQRIAAKLAAAQSKRQNRIALFKNDPAASFRSFCARYMSALAESEPKRFFNPRKNRWQVNSILPADRYSVDLQRTNSLMSPYIGTLEFEYDVAINGGDRSSAFKLRIFFAAQDNRWHFTRSENKWLLMATVSNKWYDTEQWCSDILIQAYGVTENP